MYQTQVNNFLCQEFLPQNEFLFSGGVLPIMFSKQVYTISIGPMQFYYL